MRTTIEADKDGQVLVSREVVRGIPGSSRERRLAKKRETYNNAYRTIERHKINASLIASLGMAIPGTGITIMPFGMAQELAEFNDNNARSYRFSAMYTVDEIDQQIAQFEIPEPKPLLVILQRQA